MSLQERNNLDFTDIKKQLEDSLDLVYIVNSCKVLNSSELKLIFLLKNIFKTTGSNISLLLSIDSASVKVLINQTEEILFEGLSLADLENPEKPEDEIDVITDLLFGLVNKMNYSPAVDKDDKKSIVLKIIALFKLFLECSTVNKHEIQAFLAYLYFNLSRQDTIFSKDGKIVSLREQERSKWDTDLIHKGLIFLEKSADGKNVTIYHLESAIAAIHCLAQSYNQTDWHKIVSVYDKYLSINESPYVELQRAAVVSKIKGAREGLALINNIKNLNRLIGNPILYSTLGNLNLQIHNYRQALINYEKAYEYTDIEVDKKFYFEKVKICRQRLIMISRYHFYNSF